MEIIEQIGAYAGLAAVLGLAVLSALYFSQARDVKRLREWAGRAPERVAEGATADQLARGVVAQPQPKVVQEAGAAPVVLGPKPASPAAAATAAGAAPATAAAGATPAGPGEKPAAPKPPAPVATPAAAQAAAAKPGAPAATPAAASVNQKTSEAEAATGGAVTPAGAAATAGGAGVAAPPKSGAAPASPKPAAPAAPAAKPVPRPPVRPTVPLASQSGRPAPSQTAILPPRQEDQPFYRRILGSPRYLVLTVAGVLIVGGALAFGAVQLASDDEGGTPTADRQPVDDGGDGSGDQRSLPPVSPGSVTVSVLNGTTIPGLAASIGDEVERFGFVLGNVDNSADQGARNESVVMFAPEHEREASAVGRRLRIAQREPIDPESQAIAGDAGVVVIVGTDKTQ